jgi:hypothetical protein
VNRGIGIVIPVLIIVLTHSTGLRVFGVFALLTGLVAAGFAETMRRRTPPTDRHRYSRTFRATDEATYAALGQALDGLRYRRLAQDASRRTVTFNTRISGKTWAGQDYDAVVRPISKSDTLIELTGGIAQRGLGRIQATSWGETDLLANKVLDRLEQVLS